MREYSTATVPHYVRIWFGHWRTFQLFRLSRRAWLAIGDERGLIIRAPNAWCARDSIRSFVAKNLPVTDRRRKYWEYT